LLRAKDWSSTPLGPPEHWPQSLQGVVRMMLDSRYAMWLGWGDELTFFCNDAYLPTVGLRRDWVMGEPTSKVWSEIWPDIRPRIEHVLQHGEATWDEALLLFLERNGYPEETYHTFSYSPVHDDSGAVKGNLCVVTEDTERFIGERRIRLLRDVAAQLAGAKSEAETLAALSPCLAKENRDLPFSLLYVVEADEKSPRLVVCTGLSAGDPAAPTTIASDVPWSLSRVLETGESVVTEIRALSDGLPTGAWDKPPERAILAPLVLQGQTRPGGVFIAGLNPHRPFDAAYRGFLDLLCGQIASGLSSARAHEFERRRSDALAEIDRAKTAFFSNVSHEFRTPLTLMLGPIEGVLRRPDASLTPQVRGELEVVHRNSLRLLRLVNTLLDFSRIEAGRVLAAYEPIDLATLTAELASCFRSATERAGIRLAVDCPPLRELVYVDRQMWEKIVLNLLSNAFKHTFEGQISVTVRAVGDAAEVVVRDTGIGIPSDALPRLFERFFRVEGARSRTHEGSGIGLSLVNELVGLHGGRIRVTSTEGAGSEFVVSIPLGSAHLPQEQLRRAPAVGPGAARRDAFVQEALRWLASDRESILSNDAPEGSDGAGPVDAGARIVVADDNTDMREYLTELLARHYRVEAVSDGEAALAAIERELPTLVLTDVMMPRRNGLQLIAALRANPVTSDLRVMLLTARAGEESRIEGLHAGADDYLEKPFSARELLARVRMHVSIARLRNEAMARQNALRSEAELLNDVARGLTSELGVESLIQRVTDAGAELTGATFGAFFQHVARQDGATLVLSALSGASRAGLDDPAFSKEMLPLASLLIGRTPLRVADASKDERCAIAARDAGATRYPFRSLLAVPVLARSGEHLGGLLFGHPNADVFTERAERLALGVASQAAISIDNARLFEAATRELNERLRIEDALRESEQQHRQLVRSLPAAVCTCDAEGRMTLYNDAAVSLWGRAPKLGGERWCGSYRIFQPDGSPLPLDQCPMAIALREGRSLRDAEIVIEREDGSRRFVLANPEPIRDSTGALLGAVNMLVDITDRKQLEAGLREAKDAAESANRSKDRFLAALSHELRTPLTPVHMVVAAMEADPALPQPLRSDLSMIRRNVELEMKLIDDLLDLNRIVSGKLQLHPQLVNLNEIARHVCANCRSQVLERRINLQCAFDESLAPIFVDPGRLQQVLWNVLKNAVKFTPEDGRIDVRTARVAGGRVRVQIQDSGIGIPPDILPRIFDAFEQGHANITREFGGLGLGLAISRALLELHHGSIRAESEGRGRGAQFIIELPEGGSEAEAARAESPRFLTADSRPLRLLLVEDHADTARLLGRLLEKSGHQVRIASSVSEALRLADDAQFDLIVSDLGLPDGTGYDLIRRLRSQRPIKGIAMSGYGMDDDIRKSREAGFSEHLVKPVDLVRLEQSIQRVTAR
jgi:PAS domain S-box-containing protein